jgi:hypothetical protein
MKLRRLVYTSQTEMFFSKHDLLNLLYQSRAEAIGDLLGKLIKDTRHIKLKIV